jgi:hypothetical protein
VTDFADLTKQFVAVEPGGVTMSGFRNDLTTTRVRRPSGGRNPTRRTPSLALVATAVAMWTAASPVPATVLAPTQASGVSPFAPRCHGAPQGGTLYANSEVEPWIEVNPRDPSNLIGVYQQDRFSVGSASGIGTS